MKACFGNQFTVTYLLNLGKYTANSGVKFAKRVILPIFFIALC